MAKYKIKKVFYKAYVMLSKQQCEQRSPLISLTKIYNNTDEWLRCRFVATECPLSDQCNWPSGYISCKLSAVISDCLQLDVDIAFKTSAQPMCLSLANHRVGIPVYCDLRNFSVFFLNELTQIRFNNRRTERLQTPMTRTYVKVRCVIAHSKLPTERVY